MTLSTEVGNRSRRGAASAVQRFALSMVLAVGCTLTLLSTANGETRSSAEIELPLRLILEFDGDVAIGPSERETWQHLQALNGKGVFSAEHAVTYSEADLVVYKLDGWQAAEGVLNADSLKPLLDRAKSNDPDSLTMMTVAHVSGGRRLAFLFINTSKLNLTSACVAKVIYSSIQDINPDWNDGSEIFDFRPSNCAPN